MDFIASGANLFITIVVVILAFAAGLGFNDFLKTKEKQENESE